jgi:hypothetical protein
MEVITIESQAFKELTTKINTIAKFVFALESKAEAQPADGWVDSYEVFLVSIYHLFRNIYKLPIRPHNIKRAVGHKKKGSIR